MECRLGCGACCIAPSIHTAMPGMPEGKPAGLRCVSLDSNNLCVLFGKPERPLFCHEFRAEKTICGETREEALRVIGWLEEQTS